MFNRLGEIIKKTEGNVLVIGLNDELVDKFKNNNKVNLYAISEFKSNGIFSKPNKRNTNKGKPINIKRLRKYLNRKSVDFLIINFEEIIKYYKYIIKDTIYLNNNKLYIYSKNNIDKNFIIKKYKRYNVDINITDYKNGYIISIDNTNSKNNLLKDILFFISDTLYNFAEIIGNLLIS